jgi:hypothetical protein
MTSIADNGLRDKVVLAWNRVKGSKRAAMITAARAKLDDGAL